MPHACRCHLAPRVKTSLDQPGWQPLKQASRPAAPLPTPALCHHRQHACSAAARELHLPAVQGPCGAKRCRAGPPPQTHEANASVDFKSLTHSLTLPQPGDHAPRGAAAGMGAARRADQPAAAVAEPQPGQPGEIAPARPICRKQRRRRQPCKTQAAPVTGDGCWCRKSRRPRSPLLSAVHRAHERRTFD